MLGKIHSRGACLLLGAAATLLASDVARAQIPTPTDAPSSVSVPDSPAAVERLDKAREKEQQKQWKTAAEYYQEAISKYSHRVVPEKIDKDNDVFLYTGVSQCVQERLAQWPVEGLDVYRATYGQTAADLLSAAAPGDTGALENIFLTYFVTDAGKTAGMRLMDLQLESGHFFAAAWIGQRLLLLHPTLRPGSPRGCSIARRWHITGAVIRRKRQRLLDELKLKHANETGSIGGKDVVLADRALLADRSTHSPPLVRPRPNPAMPIAGRLSAVPMAAVKSPFPPPSPALRFDRSRWSLRPSSTSRRCSASISNRPISRISRPVRQWGSCPPPTTALCSSGTAGEFTPSMPTAASRSPAGLPAAARTTWTPSDGRAGNN